jgi:hypothetical protein
LPEFAARSLNLSAGHQQFVFAFVLKALLLLL